MGTLLQAPRGVIQKRVFDNYECVAKGHKRLEYPRIVSFHMDLAKSHEMMRDSNW